MNILMQALMWYLILIYFVGAIVCAIWCTWKATSTGYNFGIFDCLLWPLFIASLCSLKSVRTGEVKETSKKAKVRFKDGAAIHLYTPAYASDKMKIAACGFVSSNRDLKIEKIFRDRARGMMNMGIGGQNVAAQSSERFRNNWL